MMTTKQLTVGVTAVLVAVCALFFVIQGCGGSSTSGTAATGTLQVGITDSPAFATFSSVHVVVDKVVAVPAGKEDLADTDASFPVIATFPSGQGVDILKLHFLPQVLGSTPIPAGSYSQIRLILAPDVPTLNNYVILSSSPTVKRPLKTPSAQETGLKIVGNFTVTAGVLNTIVLDFNPNNAIVIAGNSGNIILKPTGIRINQVFNTLTAAGAVTGTIRSPQFEPWSSATVSVRPRNPGGSLVTTGTVFSNFSSPSLWRAPFTALVPPNGSAAVGAANYKVFVQAFRDTKSLTPIFQLYSSPLFTITSGVDIPVPPGGLVLLGP